MTSVVSNTRARLRGLYGDDQALDLRPGPGGGLTVAVSVPYREEPGERDGPPADVDNRAAVGSSKSP